MGYIKLDRKMLEWEWYRDPMTRLVFLHILLKANWKDGSFLGVKIPRGSMATSVKSLSEDNCATFQQTRTALKHLQKTGEITITRHSKFSIITVVNYSKYQSDNNHNDNHITTEKQAVKQSPNNSLTTIEERKKGRNKKEYIGAFKISENQILQSAFDDFIEMRKKIKKPMTERAITNMVAKLKRLSTDEYEQADILDQSTYHAWQDVYPLKTDFVSTRVRPQGTSAEVKEEEHEMTDEEWEAMYEPGGKMYVGDN